MGKSRRIELTMPQIQTLKQMCDYGNSLTDIAKVLHCSHGSVETLCERYGLVRTRGGGEVWTSKEDDAITKGFAEGLSLDNIAYRVHRKADVVELRAKVLGVDKVEIKTKSLFVKLCGECKGKYWKEEDKRDSGRLYGLCSKLGLRTERCDICASEVER